MSQAGPLQFVVNPADRSPEKNAPATSSSTIEIPVRPAKDSPTPQQNETHLPVRPRLESSNSKTSARAPNALLSGKQEHYLKRELIARQVDFEITDLASTTALQRFGAPFRSDYGEISPVDSEFPILRHIFVQHIRKFPFLDQAREKEFWQDKLQVFLELFANKHISSSEDRLEETKRRKLALKARKLVELMMVSGIPTSSGYEERIRFSEIEVVDRGANEQGLLVNQPEGKFINGWDVNVAGVRHISVKRNIRYHQHAEFLIRVQRKGESNEYFIGKRYGDFAKLRKQLFVEFPGKVFAPPPSKNKSHSTVSFSFSGKDDDASSISSVSTTQPSSSDWGISSYIWGSSHKRSSSTASVRNRALSSDSPRRSMDGRPPADTPSDNVTLFREDQRVSLRAFLRTYLQNASIANSRSMEAFLTNSEPIILNREERLDMDRRKQLDARRIEEQRKFYEIARQRAKELDTYMEKFRRDIVERNGLTKLFAEIKIKEHIADLTPEYQKFVEWLRIEVAATVYHIFLAEDNSPDLFAQAKSIHGMVPYGALKQVIRYSNPALVMKGVLNLFLAHPLGTRSLAQRAFGFALDSGIREYQRSIELAERNLDDVTFAGKVRNFVEADEAVKETVRKEAAAEDTDLLICIMRCEDIEPVLDGKQLQTIFHAYTMWNNAVENVNEEIKAGAELFTRLKQLLKLYTRKRDKIMMASVIDEPVTLNLFRDLFTIFYEPLVRVYKSANVYNSVTDFARFADDAIAVITKYQSQDCAADPNQTVQAFIDLCARHQDNLYKFIHEVHVHDNGLFTSLMGWIEEILQFLRFGPSGGKLNINALFEEAVEKGQIDKDKAIAEVAALVKWQSERKKWHSDKTRQKMAADGSNPDDDAGGDGVDLMRGFNAGDFGMHSRDLDDLHYDESESDDEDEQDDEQDPIVAERKRREKKAAHLRRSAGEPVKPVVTEVVKLMPEFNKMLRGVLA